VLKKSIHRMRMIAALAFAGAIATGCLSLTQETAKTGPDAGAILRPAAAQLKGAPMSKLAVESKGAIPDLPFTSRLIRRVAEQSKDAVVSIYVQTSTPYRLKLKPVSLFGGLSLSVPGVGLGSGFFIHPSGYILTNNHVIEDAEQIKIQTADGKDHAVTVIARDPVYDLALLKTADAVAQSYPALPMGDSRLAAAGDMVIAVGNPLGLGHTVTAGIISQTGRNMTGEPKTKARHAEYIQTDTAINPGSSGGPLITFNGNWVAVNTARLSDAEGIGFSVPSAQARKFLENILAGRGAQEE
jgi:S1-C subfamily serine protease